MTLARLTTWLTRTGAALRGPGSGDQGRGPGVRGGGVRGLALRAAHSPGRLAVGIMAGVVLVFAISMVAISKIDDNPDFAPPHPALGRSHTVAMVGALIARELEVNKWRANDPFFLPGGWLRDMPAFQLGLVGALARVTGALAADHGAGWTPSGPDHSLYHAAGLLKYPGTVWKFDTRTSWLPTASAEKQYRFAQRSLEAYNEAIYDGSSGFDRGPEALALLVEALIQDLDESVRGIDAHLAAGHSILFDFSLGDVFFHTKGRLYAHSVVMREVGRDFESTLAQRRLTQDWTAMVERLAAAARPRPLLLWNAAPDSALLPNHLLSLGYPAAQARLLAGGILAGLRAP